MQLSFVLVPIVLGAILTGVPGGAILGFLFGAITLIMGIFGVDQFTFILFSDHPVLTILTCIVKATAAGALAGIVYSGLGDVYKRQMYFLIIGCAGINFIVEFAINLLLAPSVYRIIKVVKKQ